MKMASKKKQMPTKQKYQILLVGVILTIVLIGYVFFAQRSSENYKDIKQYKNEYLIYTKYQDKNTTYSKEVPYVNLKANVFKKVNEDITLFCQDYINSKKSVISYEYDINGIILSLVVKVINNDTTYAPEPYFRTYNINLETQEVIADDALLQFFNVNKTTVENKIKRQFQNYYSDLIKEKYYTTSECSYDCFLKWRGVDKYLDYVSYYVREGNLIAYKSFIAYSMFGEEEYFEDEDYEFEIATAPITE